MKYDTLEGKLLSRQWTYTQCCEDYSNIANPKNEENPRIAEEKILKRINKLKVL